MKQVVAMINLQVERVLKRFDAYFDHASATAAVARAYGYTSLNPGTGEPELAVPGLQQVSSYYEILQKDPTHQVMDFMRMALNLSIPDRHDYRNGVPEKELVSTMLNFPDFDSVLAYARSDGVDPNTTNEEMLAKFRRRYGYFAPIQYLLGYQVKGHTYVIQPDRHLAQRFIDQEITLNPLDKLSVVIVRTGADAGTWLTVMSPAVSVTHSEGPSIDQYAMGDKPVLVSVVSDQKHSLSLLVERHAHLQVAGEVKRHRTLIVDGIDLDDDPADHARAFKLASGAGIHLVVVSGRPTASLWHQASIRLIFGFPDGLSETDMEMDKHIAFAAPYVGLMNGKMQYLYASEESGPVYGAMDLIPDSPEVKSIVQRLKEAVSA
tara:strand:+ start:36618 stop:37751 length:1134 start_codon:yes stop_codon:yes gene_type:complete